MDNTDRAIINLLQDGIPVCDRPFQDAAGTLGLDEPALLERLGRLLERRVLSRLGPMFDAQGLGGAFTLCAMQIPTERFEDVAATVNAFDEVAHNYERDHDFNMWFVIGAESRTRIDTVITEIQRATGLSVLDLPKLEEFFIGLRLEA